MLQMSVAKGRMKNEDKTDEGTLLNLDDSELAVLLIHKLLQGKWPHKPAHDEARAKAFEVMAWLYDTGFMSEEEKAGCKSYSAWSARCQER